MEEKTFSIGERDYVIRPKMDGNIIQAEISHFDCFDGLYRLSPDKKEKGQFNSSESEWSALTRHAERLFRAKRTLFAL